MPDDDRETLQHFMDTLFRDRPRIPRLDAVMLAESLDIGEDLSSIIALLPPGTYTRQRMADQLNSALVGHGWSRHYGTVE